MSVTIKQIALELGVSASTVSRALRDDYTISKKTKETVQNLANSLNYQRNPFALMLRKQRANSIAVLIPQISHSYFSEMLSAISEQANLYGYQLVIYQSNDSYTREASIIRNTLMDRVDGLIAIFSKETKDFSHFLKAKGRIPILFVDRACQELENHSIITDDYTGAWKATEHLITEGYQKIAYLGTADDLLINEVRELGYQDALKEYGNGSTAYPPLICNSNSMEEAKTRVSQVLSLPKSQRPDAIFANDDLLALGALMAAKELGVKVPEDLGVVGFGDLSFASLLSPSLTTVKQNGKTVGTKAAKLLLNHLEDETEALETKIIDTELIIRDSSRRSA